MENLLTSTKICIKDLIKSKKNIKEGAKKLFEAHPDYINLDFTKLDLPLQSIKVITEYQNSLDLATKNNENKINNNDNAKKKRLTLKLHQKENNF